MSTPSPDPADKLTEDGKRAVEAYVQRYLERKPELSELDKLRIADEVRRVAEGLPAKASLTDAEQHRIDTRVQELADKRRGRLTQVLTLFGVLQAVAAGLVLQGVRDSGAVAATKAVGDAIATTKAEFDSIKASADTHISDMRSALERERATQKDAFNAWVQGVRQDAIATQQLAQKATAEANLAAAEAALSSQAAAKTREKSRELDADLERMKLATKENAKAIAEVMLKDPKVEAACSRTCSLYSAVKVRRRGRSRVSVAAVATSPATNGPSFAADLVCLVISDVAYALDTKPGVIGCLSHVGTEGRGSTSTAA